MSKSLIIFAAFLGLSAAQFPCYDKVETYFMKWRIKDENRNFIHEVVYNTGSHDSAAQAATEKCNTVDRCTGIRCYEDRDICELCDSWTYDVVNKGDEGWDEYVPKVASLRDDTRSSYLRRADCDPAAEELSIDTEDEDLTITPRFTTKSCSVGEKCYVSWTVTDSAGETVLKTKKLKASICQVAEDGSLENCQNAKKDREGGFLFRRVGVWKKNKYRAVGDWVLTMEQNGETVTSDPISVSVVE